METIRWGILSTGNIAHSFATGLQSVPDGELVAVGSRSQESADTFAAEFDIPNAYGSYQDLANAPDIDVVYIGTPHVFHAENTIMCLKAGKHVICEKPFTINAAEAQACIDLAREKKLFLMEAVWMRFIPAILELQTWIKEGKIGEIQLVQADFSFYIPYMPEHRLFNKALGGGALLDVGIYPVSFTTMLLGLPDSVHSHARMSASGVDEQSTYFFTYENGASALLSSGITGNLVNEAVVKGTTGKITVPPDFFYPNQLILHPYGEDAQVVDIPFEGNGYNYEAMAVQECIRAGKIEHPNMPHEETLAVMKLMDDMRAEWGLVYPQEA